MSEFIAVGGGRQVAGRNGSLQAVDDRLVDLGEDLDQASPNHLAMVAGLDTVVADQAPVPHARPSLTYRGLLALPGARRACGAAAVARLSFGMAGLSLLLLIHHATGSFAAAGAAGGAYSAAKTGLTGLTSHIAAQYGAQGIRCNAINPGLIRTEGGMKNVYGPMVGIMERNTLVPRLGQAMDIGAMAVYLCSDDAEFITGSTLSIKRR